ncbi:ABC transporter permease [Chryseosolibacter indicus]|uniref:ABC transporter permease n=1 Tax=Chryseosolibacter indicus TaxID=2782351 RepID=A0ABS5W0S9_9BACT|nr:ABC transporter permease [Chryseosolibacter indicus]MBT1705886.1 ABC transporter permease [Chryseosolibacter indicus]
MIQSYFKIALRSLIRNKGFTAINILGLVLGISFSTMLYTYVRHELSYDSFHQKADRTFRVLTTDNSNPNEVRTFGRTSPPMGPQLMSSFPEVKEMTRLFRLSGQVIVEIGDAKYNERNWFTTSDSNFFDIFDFDLIAGNEKTALAEPFSVILTASTAKKYFSNENPLGKIIKTGAGEVKVTGVIKDIPINSHLQFDLLFSSIRAGEEWERYLNDWQGNGAFTYIVLENGKSIGDVQAKMPEFIAKYWGPGAAVRSTQFQPIQDIYLHAAHVEAGIESAHGEVSYIYIFSSMAVFLLIIAAINYVNLTTSKASLRAKEIGIRKVVGAIKRQLIIQFLTEAFVITLFSMLLSIAAIDLCLPFFNSITGKNFDLTLNTLGEYMPSLLLIALLIGVIAGSYPAFYLSKLKPVIVLKGQPVLAKNSFDFRTALVVFQFTVTLVLIVSILIIGRQIDFIQSKDLGFDKEEMLVIDINSRAVRNQFQVMKNEFLAIPGVREVAVSSQVPGEWKVIDEVHVRTTTGNTTMADSLEIYFMGFDENMLNTYQLQLASGNYFSGRAEVDSLNVLLNESAVKAMNLKSALGSKVQVSAYGVVWEANVIGVLKDFNFQSLHQKIAPMIIGFRTNPIAPIDYFSLKVSGNTQALIEEVSQVHEKFDTRTPIEYHFLSDQLNMFYVSENKAGMIFKMAGILSIIVACLGLLGMAAYHVERRTKELGVRKILGAGPLNLFLMISFSFIRNVFLAFILACPLAWYIMREWLSAFEYRIQIEPSSFILAGVFVLMLVFITVGYQSLKAALHNPIHALRQE